MTPSADQALLDQVMAQRNEALNAAATNGAGLKLANDRLAVAGARIAELEAEVAALTAAAAST